jgi:predicted small integral membrane protein
LHLLFYLGIIAWEIMTTILLAWSAVRLFRARRAAPSAIDRAKDVAVLALTLSLLMWLVAFLAVGGEWFLMWQSRQWNGQEEAFRMFAVVGLILLFVTQPERESQP